MKKQLRFLVVEDNDLDVEKIERGLKKIKATKTIVRARDGREALEVLRGSESRERLEPPYIVLLDLNMPRMTGFEFLEELRADVQLRNTAIFVLTTSDRPSDVEMAHDYLVCGYIVKPINQSQMLEALSTLDGYWELCEHPAP